MPPTGHQDLVLPIRREHPRQSSGRAEYLINGGPVPPPTPQQVAVAQFYAGIDRAQASAPPNGNGPLPLPMAVGPVQEAQVRPQTAAEPAREQVIVREISLSVPTPEGKVDLALALDLEPIDFIEKILLQVREDPSKISLGYKFPSETGPPNRLKDSDDVKNLCARWVKYRANRRTSPNSKVTIHVIKTKGEDTAPKKKSAAATQKDADKDAKSKAAAEDCSAEFQLCMEKLRCNCRGERGNRWCWKDPKNPTAHIPLSLEDLHHWARAMKNDPDADRTCKVRPNSKGFDDKINTAIRRQTSPKKAVSTDGSAGRPLHVHITNALPDSQRPGGIKRTLDEALDSDTTPPIPLLDVLQELDKRMPAAKLLSYADSLRENGFYYAQNVVDSAEELHIFTDQVGLPAGLVRTFIREVTAQVRKSISAKRPRASDEKENIPPLGNTNTFVVDLDSIED